MTFRPAANAMRRAPATIQRLTGAGCASSRRCPRVPVVQRPPKLLHQRPKRRFRDEGSRPEPLVQLRFSHHARGFIDEQGQQVEGFGRQMKDSVAAHDLPAV